MIEITSEYGRIGSFHWLNTNQEYHFEFYIDGPLGGWRPRTLPIWWGCCWLDTPPQWLIDHLNFVSSQPWT